MKGQKGNCRIAFPLLLFLDFAEEKGFAMNNMHILNDWFD